MDGISKSAMADLKVSDFVHSEQLPRHPHLCSLWIRSTLLCPILSFRVLCPSILKPPCSSSLVLFLSLEERFPFPHRSPPGAGSPGGWVSHCFPFSGHLHGVWARSWYSCLWSFSGCSESKSNWAETLFCLYILLPYPLYFLTLLLQSFVNPKRWGNRTPQQDKLL